MQSVGRYFLLGDHGKVDKRQAALLGDLGHRGRVFGQDFTVLRFRQVGKAPRRHEASRRKEDDARRMAPEFVEETMVIGLELGEAARALERFSLTKLQDERRGASGLKLPFPRTEIQVTPLLMDRVCFPGHGAEDGVLRGEDRGESGLDLSGLGLADEILLADKNDDFVLTEVELSVLEGGWRRPRGLHVAEAVHDRLLRRDRQIIQRVEHDITEADLRFAVAVDLETDEAVGIINGRIGLGVIQGRFAIEEDRDARPFGPDLILVPLTTLLQLGDLGVGLDPIGTYAAAGTCQELLAAGFVVEGAGMAMADVGLIADHLVGRIGRALAAELHAGVHETFGADELILERQAEVIKAALGRQELVARITGHRATHDFAVLDAPDLSVTVPSRQRLAIEQRRRCGHESEDSGEQGQNGCGSLHGVSELGNPPEGLFQEFKCRGRDGTTCRPRLSSKNRDSTWCCPYLVALVP